MDLKVALLLGTVRSERESIKAANYVASFAKNYPEIELTFVDPRTLHFEDEGEEGKDPTYTEIVKDADAFIIVTPEYNHGYPSTLKRMIDSEYTNYFKKPVALVGVSNGSWGGTRVCEALLPVCHRVGLVPIHSEVYFPRIQDLFDDNDQLKNDYEEMYNKNLRKMYDELLWFARTLKVGRET